MWQTFRSFIEDDFIDEEDIIAKIQYLENLTNQNRYIPWGDYSGQFSSRLTSAIQNLPEQHTKAALALFANIIYIPKPILDESWREVAFTLSKLLAGINPLFFSNTIYFSLDDPGLITHFSHIANLPGREDHNVNPGFDSVSDVINKLYNLIGSKKTNADIHDIIILMKKRNWVLLSDNSISGGSLTSEAKKLLRVLSILFPPGLTPSFMSDKSVFSVPGIYAASQIITDQALSDLDEIIPREQIVYGIKFDDGSRIVSDKCKLFRKDETLRAVRKLCEWFGDKFFLNRSNPDFIKRINAHLEAGGSENYAYGWKNCGYTIVTQEHALSNAVPVIYYSPPNKVADPKKDGHDNYTPPFPRIESRLTHTTSEDKVKLSEVEKWENLSFIRNLLYGIK